MVPEYREHSDTFSAVCPMSLRTWLAALLVTRSTDFSVILGGVYCLMLCICIHPIYSSRHLTASVIGQLVSEMLIYRSADDIMCVCTCERQQ